MRYKYEVHMLKTNGEDLGILTFENGETAVYTTEKLARLIADGMNAVLAKHKECMSMKHKYVVVEKEA